MIEITRGMVNDCRILLERNKIRNLNSFRTFLDISVNRNGTATDYTRLYNFHMLEPDLEKDKIIMSASGNDLIDLYLIRRLDIDKSIKCLRSTIYASVFDKETNKTVIAIDVDYLDHYLFKFHNIFKDALQDILTIGTDIDRKYIELYADVMILSAFETKLQPNLNLGVAIDQDALDAIKKYKAKYKFDRAFVRLSQI